MRIGLVYEDEPIRIAFELLIPKILGEAVDVVPVLGGSWPGIVGKVPSLLQVLSVKHISSPLDCVIVLIDANGATNREQRLSNKVGNRPYRFGVPIFHAIVHQIETWLLGDSNAVNTAANTHLPVVHNPELLLDAKRHLIQILKNQGRNPYDRNFVRVAAGVADVNHIAQSCAGFRTFTTKLQACRQQQRLF